MKTKLIVAGVTALLMTSVGHAQSWSLLGDAGTVDGINFLGTTDNVPLTFRVNNIMGGRIDQLSNNAFFGYNAGNGPLSGLNNAVFGTNAFMSNFGGSRNSVFGTGALANGSGFSNAAFGYNALGADLAGNSNAAFGTNAMANNGIGFNNTAIGTGALSGGTEPVGNVAIGYNCLAGTDAFANTGVGYFCLATNGSGIYNAALGAYSDVNSSGYINATALGAHAIATADNMVRIGDANVTVIEGQPAFYTSSDGRFKTNLSEDDVKGLDFITRLRPVVYNFDTKKFEDFLSKNMPDSIRRKRLSRDFSKSTAIRRTGFIAQEVEKAAKEAKFNFDGIRVPANENENYSLAYGEFVVPLVKAVQEQQAMIEKMNAMVQEQNKKMQQQDQLISELRKQNTSTGINEINTASTSFFMGQNEPNPFSHETVIKYSLPAGTNAAYLAVYDLSGKQITTFGIERNSTFLTVTSEKLPAGIYIYSIVTDGKILDSKRMIVADK